MDFVALDFETATNDRHNPCEIGLTFVENNRIVETKSWLIKPQHFDPSYKRFHGMKPKDVSSSPAFPEVWKEVRPLIEGKFVIAHNASVFDIVVLRKTLKHFGLPYPNITYGCTIKFAKKVFPGRNSYALDVLCETHKISFSHHRAGEDARACAELALIMFKKYGIVSVEDISSKLYINLGRLRAPDRHQPIEGISARERQRQEKRQAKERQRQQDEERAKEAKRKAEEWMQQLQEAEARKKKEEEARRKEEAHQQWLRQQEEELRHWKQQQEEERLERERQEEERREKERKAEQARIRKEERRQWRQEHENLIVVAIVGIFALIFVLGFVGMWSAGERMQANRLAEQERIIAEERLAAEQREQEQKERLAAEERRREAQEQYEAGMVHDDALEYTEAEKCFRFAAERGHAKAQVKRERFLKRGGIALAFSVEFLQNPFLA